MFRSLPGSIIQWRAARDSGRPGFLAVRPGGIAEPLGATGPHLFAFFLPESLCCTGALAVCLARLMSCEGEME